MAKLWAGRTSGETDALADQLNDSISFDRRLWREDIQGSMAHARMLGDCGIIPRESAEEICEGLSQILADLESGALTVDETCEDIHTFVEQTLTARKGEAGKMLHTARSRNDQVALDLRLWIRKTCDEIITAAESLISAVTDRAEEYKDAVMPGYTHLQRAQPITFGHHLMAYAMMLLRDRERLCDCRRRLNRSPIGCCALAGTTYPVDRRAEAAALGFDGICENSLDGVSDRDFCLEMLSCISILMMHLSRFSEEILLWTSREFDFVSLDEAYATGSSIMPQKKNSDMAELVRGKTGRVYGDLMGLLTTMKGLPLAYNKDMQEDKEPVFDAADTCLVCLKVFTGMVSTFTARREQMLSAAGKGFLNATDLADYLVSKGIPFRDAYRISGKAVARCTETGHTLEDLPLDEYRALCPAVDEGVYAAVDLRACVERRTSEGGTCVENVEHQIALVREQLR